MKRTCLIIALALSLTAFIGCKENRQLAQPQGAPVDINADANDIPGNPDATIADQGQGPKKKNDKPTPPPANKEDNTQIQQQNVQIQEQNGGKVDTPAKPEQEDVIKPEVKGDNSDVKTF